jgi:hypothetical protein
MTRVQRLAIFLEAHFGEVEFHQPDETGSEEREAGERSDEEPSLLVRLDEADARIDLMSLVSKKINKRTALSLFLLFLLFFSRLFRWLNDELFDIFIRFCSLVFITPSGVDRCGFGWEFWL